MSWITPSFMLADNFTHEMAKHSWDKVRPSARPKVGLDRLSIGDPVEWKGSLLIKDLPPGFGEWEFPRQRFVLSLIGRAASQDHGGR
jgi:hypothetical protein